MELVVPPFPGVSEMSGGSARVMEAEVSQWMVADGEVVAQGQETLEITLDKVMVVVESPSPGVLRHQAAVGDLIQPGDIVGVIETT